MQAATPQRVLTLRVVQQVTHHLIEIVRTQQLTLHLCQCPESDSDGNEPLALALVEPTHLTTLNAMTPTIALKSISLME
jgi:hypothetical protein